MKHTMQSGFYDSVAGDRRYNAADMGRLFDGMITDGVYLNIGKKFFVRPDTVANKVIVGSGRAWFNGQWMRQESDVIMDLFPSDLLMARKDGIFIVVNQTDGVRECYLEVVTGSPSASPQAPVEIHNAYINSYRIATITVPAKATLIRTENIHYEIGISTPFAAGILNKVEPGWYIQDFLVSSNLWLTDFKAIMESWKTSTQSDVNNFVDAFEINLAAWELSTKTSFEATLSGYLAEVADIKSQLETDVSNMEDYIAAAEEAYEVWITAYKASIQANWDTFLSDSETAFNTFITSKSTEFNTLYDTQFDTFNTFMTNSNASFNTFITDKGIEFTAWWDVLKDQLDDIDVAGLLTRLGIVETNIALKADTSYVDTELGKRVLTTKFNTDMGLKADTSYVDTELGKRVLTTKFNTDMGLKADKTYVDTKIGDIDLALQGVLAGE